MSNQADPIRTAPEAEGQPIAPAAAPSHIGRYRVVRLLGQGSFGRVYLRRYPRLRLERRPAYAPELNPVEALWSYVKYGQLANFVPHDVYHLDDVVLEHLIDIKLEPGLLEALWQGSDLPLPTGTSQPSDQ
jgi:putative transposase